MEINQSLLYQKKESIKNIKFNIKVLGVTFVFLLYISISGINSVSKLEDMFLCIVSFSIVISIMYSMIGTEYREFKTMTEVSDDQFLKKYEKYNLNKTITYRNGFYFNELITDTYLIKKNDELFKHILLENCQTKELKQITINDLVTNYQ